MTQIDINAKNFQRDSSGQVFNLKPILFEWNFRVTHEWEIFYRFIFFYRDWNVAIFFNYVIKVLD